MRIRKIISLLCIAAILFSYAVLPAAAEESTDTSATVTYVFDNFEDENLSDWEFRNTYNGDRQSAYITEEGGNKFLRIKFNGQYAGSDGGKATTYSKKFTDGAFALDTSNYTVVEMKIRTNANSLRKLIKFNYPRDNDPLDNGYNELAWNTRILYVMNNGNLGKVTNSPANAPKQGNVSNMLTYSVNKWYTARIVYDHTNDTASFYVYDEAGELAGSSVDDQLTAWWFNKSGYDQAEGSYIWETIEDITIQFRNDGSVTNETFDFDDLKIYNQDSVVSAEVLNNTDINIIYKPETITVKFDAPINYTEGGIKVLDSTDALVEHTGVYDEKNLTYTATFDSALSGGNYKVLLDSVTPLNNTYGKISEMLFEQNIIPFTTYDALPPAARDLNVSGRIIKGNILTASYTYDCADEEGASVYEWYMSPSGSGEWTKIENASSKELEVTEAMEGSHIKFAVTPKSVTNLVGNKYESDILYPETAPVVTDVEISPSAVYTNSEITVTYTYSDVNGDAEGSSEIIWYAAPSPDGEWTQVKTGDTYYVADTDTGKYIKVSVTPVNNAPEAKRGETKVSAAVGPIDTIVNATNLFRNPGFEDGVLGDWRVSASPSENYKGIEIYDQDAYEGNYSIRVYPRYVNGSDSWSQAVNLVGGKRYIVSGLAKKLDAGSPNVTQFEAYPWGGGNNLDRPYREKEYTSITDSENWTRISLTIDTKVSSQFSFGFVSFQTYGHELIMDNLYVGPLLIGDIETESFPPITIPEEGTVVLPVTTGVVYNQFGERDGVENEKATVSVNAPGVTLDGNNVVIDSTAVAGLVPIEVICVPSFPGAEQAVFKKTINLELVANNNKQPQVKNVYASGTVATGATLNASFEYYQIEGKESATEIIWQQSDSEDGVYYDIPGATELSYTVPEEYSEKFFRLAISPKTVDGDVGTTVYTNVLTKPRAPKADNIKITGEFNVGSAVTGEYTYKDPNNDPEGETSVRWLVSDAENGTYTEIPGETTQALILTEALIDKYIKFAVTPISIIAPETGEECISKAYFGPAAPVATNVSINKEGYRLEGTYKYNHVHNAPELDTIFKWTVDGMVVSSSIDYVVDFTGTKTVTFTVIPVGKTNPGMGKSVTVSAIVTGYPESAGGNATGGFVGGSGGFGSGGGSGGSSGGGGASGFASGITNINNMDYTQKSEADTADGDKNADKGTDIEGHWGAQYIKEMVELGVMNTDENGNHNPDALVSREEMITFLFKALKLEASEYNGMFADVSTGDFAGMLQTMVDNGTIAKDTSFRPEDTITREEICKILYISLENAGKLNKTDEVFIDSFDDFETISDWAREYVNGIYALKIMIGVSDTRFAPQEVVTKAQAATMLSRINTLMKEDA